MAMAITYIRSLSFSLLMMFPRAYKIYANVQNTVQMTSFSFFVQNGTNTSCVSQFVAVPFSSTSAIPGPGATNTSTSITLLHHSNAGVIAGGAISGIAFLAAAFVAFLYLYLRW
jgi:hypothetical protein